MVFCMLGLRCSDVFWVFIDMIGIRDLSCYYSLVGLVYVFW